ncbi:trigger factor, partial [Pelagibacteraceae bacterium]|nr:trigger factor [Pelagibacteraceae bacterium]
SLKGGIYEEKILKLIKSKIKLSVKNLTSVEAEKIITNFNKLNTVQNETEKSKPKKIKTKK